MDPLIDSMIETLPSAEWKHSPSANVQKPLTNEATSGFFIAHDSDITIISVAVFMPNILSFKCLFQISNSCRSANISLILKNHRRRSSIILMYCNSGRRFILNARSLERLQSYIYRFAVCVNHINCHVITVLFYCKNIHNNTTFSNYPNGAKSFLGPVNS